MQILEHKDGEVLCSEALEEEAPRRVEIARIRGDALLETDEVREAGFHPPPLLTRLDEFLDGTPQLLTRQLRWLVVENAGTHTHHLAQRPVGDTISVGETAPAMPPDGFRDPVDVLEELPTEARLPDAGKADDREQARRALLAGRVQELLDQSQLPVASDERRFQSGRAERPSGRRNDALRSPQTLRFRLSLELVHPSVLVSDRGFRGDASPVTDIDSSGLSRCLHARCSVDEVAGDHPLASHSDADRDFAGHQPRSGLQTGRTDLVAKCDDGIDQLERCAHRSLGVVFLTGGHAPHGHDSVADELFNLATVASDDRARGVEVATQEFADVLSVALLREWCESHQVGKQHGHMAAFGETRRLDMGWRR